MDRLVPYHERLKVAPTSHRARHLPNLNAAQDRPNGEARLGVSGGCHVPTRPTKPDGESAARPLAPGRVQPPAPAGGDGFLTPSRTTSPAGQSLTPRVLPQERRAFQCDRLGGGQGVEAATIGNEGMVGIPALL